MRLKRLAPSRRDERFAFGLLSLLLAYASHAQATSPAQVDGFDAWEKCSALQNVVIPAPEIGLPTRGARVVHAKLIPASPTNPYGEHCLVDGEIFSVSPLAQNIEFSMALPSRWNGKSLHFGGGGMDGVNLLPLFINPPSDWSMQPSPAVGYVAFSSDSGHQGRGEQWAALNDASFAANEEELRNFAGEQLKKTHDAVMTLVNARYGRRPTRSYFVGGSEGGREAVTVIQDYPDDYEGVVSLYPAIGLVPLFLKEQVISRAMRLNNGIGTISRDQADFLRGKELAACDKEDKLEDSILSNLARCQFDFGTLRCPEGKEAGAECFSDAQLSTLRIIHSPTRLPYVLANGIKTLPGFPIGADLANSLVEDAIGLNPSERLNSLVLKGSLAYPLLFDPLQPGKLLPLVQQASQLLDRTRVDVDRFIARGGKWMLIQGLADEVVPASQAIEYYNTLLAKYGQAQTDKFLRFYLVPGYAHGRGTAFNAYDIAKLNVLDDWVDGRMSPGTLTVVDTNPASRGRSRPMCVYPAWPQYINGSDPDLASSFSCQLN